MILNQALALASKCGDAHKVKKKSNYKEVKTDHLCLHDNLRFQNMVFLSILFAIWHTMYVPDKQTDRTLALFEWKGLNLQFPNTQNSELP